VYVTTTITVTEDVRFDGSFSRASGRPILRFHNALEASKASGGFFEAGQAMAKLWRIGLKPVNNACVVVCWKRM